MLQRLKGAIDRLAEEEETARITEQQRLQRSGTHGRKPNTQGSSNTHRSSQQGLHNPTEAAGGIIVPSLNLSASEQVAVDIESNASPQPPASTGLEKAVMAEDSSEHISSGQIHETSSIVIESSEGEAIGHEGQVGISPELPLDVRTKLRRLTKLEGKYQELLRAYRQAHARNSTIEPFEAKLRETTPLTSIGDPQAFVEYLDQLSLRSEMVIDELKNVSSEKELMREKLEEAERKTREARDEVAILKSERTSQSETSGRLIGAIYGNHGAMQDEIDDTNARRVGKGDGGSPPIPPLIETRLSPNSEPEGRHEEAQKQKSGVNDLQTQVCISTTTQELTERTKRDLDTAESQLPALQAANESSESASRDRCSILEKEAENLQEKLRVAEIDAEMRQKQLRESDATSEKLQSELRLANEELQSLKSLSLAAQPRLDSETNGQASEARLGVLTQKSTASDETGAAGSKKKKNKKKKKPSSNPSNNADDNKDDQGAKEELRNLTNTDHPNANASGLSTSHDIQALHDLSHEKDSTISQLKKKLKDQEDLQEEIDGLRDELISVGQEHVEAKEALKRIQEEKDALNVSVKDLDAQIVALQAKTMAHNSTFAADTNSKTNSTHGERATHHDTSKRSEIQLEALASKESEIEELRTEREGLLNKKAELEQQLTQIETGLQSRDTESEKIKSALQTEVNNLKIQASALQTDLSAAQQLAASRFRDLAELKERFQKMQPELTYLRSEVSELRSSRDDQAAKIAETRRLELRLGELRSETSLLRKEILEREAEIKNLQQKFSEENDQREAMEEFHRKTQRMLQRTQRDKTDALTAKEDIAKILQKAQAELERYRQLEDQVAQLNRENVSLRDDIELKSAQYASAQSLMSSLQDQTAEMATQNKETKERCESLEEELIEVCRQRDGRSREAETMRRLLAEVEGRAESRIKAMKDRLDNANEERDRAEDDASTIGRRRARELDELKSRVRTTEKDLKQAFEAKLEHDRLTEELQNSSERSASQLSGVTQELAATKESLKSLKDILQDGEIQIRDLESEKTDLKRNLEEAQLRLDKQKKLSKSLGEELRLVRGTNARASESPAQSSRSSQENSAQVSRVMSPHSGEKSLPRAASTMSTIPGSASTVDYGYLKQILLQFVEQKDRKHQLQLVPVLAILLKFDKKDEQKWKAAISAK